MCFRPIYNGTGPQTKPWHLSPRGLVAPYPKHFFWLIPMCKWFPIDSKICMTLKCSISYKSTIGIFSWTCVGGCKSMQKVCSCGTKTSIDLSYPTLDCSNMFKHFKHIICFAHALNILPTIKSTTTLHSQIHEIVHFSYIRVCVPLLRFTLIKNHIIINRTCFGFELT